LAAVKLVGWVALYLTGAFIVVNAFFMLVSPTAWFRLPRWLRANGSLTKERYAAGWGSVEVRLAGAGILGMIGWVLYAFITKR
jgi:hypothetical protein